MGQAQINVRIRACSRTSIARTKQAALTHNVRGKELNEYLAIDSGKNVSDLVFAHNCSITRMISGDTELVSE